MTDTTTDTSTNPAPASASAPSPFGPHDVFSLCRSQLCLQHAFGPQMFKKIIDRPGYQSPSQFRRKLRLPTMGPVTQHLIKLDHCIHRRRISQ